MTEKYAATINIISAENLTDLASVKVIFQAYAKWVKTTTGIDLSRQHFEKDMAAFPKNYDLLLLAKMDGDPVGAIGLKRFDNTACEMKRLFVGPQYHGYGIGKKLVHALIEEAKLLGYHRMLLDTYQQLSPAITLYEAFGFKKIKAYTYNPEKNVVYMELILLE